MSGFLDPRVSPANLDALTANKITNPASAVGAALNATIGEQVPSAVSDAVAGLDLVEGSDSRLPESAPLDTGLYLAVTTDLDGKMAQGFRADGSVEVPRLRAGGALTEAFTSDDVAWSAPIDSAGRVPEVQVDWQGQVPPHVLRAWGGRMGVTYQPYDVVVFAGQSNATLRSTLPANMNQADPRIMRYAYTSGVIEPFPVDMTEWIGSGFAREYVRANPTRRLLVVETGQGGTGFTPNVAGTWDRNSASTPNLYQRMLTYTAGALAVAGPGARLVGMVWSQGETDAGSKTQAQYAALLDDLIGAARTAWGTPTLPVVIGGLTPDFIEANAGAPPIAAALEDTPRRVQYTAYVPGPDNLGEWADTIHWSPQGQAIRGSMFAGKGLYRARLNISTAQPIPPQHLRVERSGTKAIIRWEAPPARATAFEVRYSTDEGTNWTSPALPNPLALESTLTVTAGLPLWVQARSINEVGTTVWTRKVTA